MMRWRTSPLRRAARTVILASHQPRVDGLTSPIKARPGNSVSDTRKIVIVVSNISLTGDTRKIFVDESHSALGARLDRPVVNL